MPQVRFTTWKLNARNGHNFQAEPLTNGPNKTVEIATLDDVKRELATFAEEAKATGKPWLIMTNFNAKSGRKPKGYNAADARQELVAFVNDNLCDKSLEA